MLKFIVAELRQSLKLYSQRLNLLVSFVIAYLIASGGNDIPKLLAYLPGKWGAILAPLGGLIAFLAVSYARLVPQTNLDCDK